MEPSVEGGGGGGGGGEGEGGVGGVGKGGKCVKSYTNGHGPLIQMAIYKHLKIFFSRTKKALGLNLGV